VGYEHSETTLLFTIYITFMKKNLITILSILLLVGFLLPTSCTHTNKLDEDDVKMKVGQMFLLAFSGAEAQVVLPFISEKGIGGLYLSNENLQEPKQAAQLLNELQAAAMSGISKQALLTACDQEGAWGVMVPYSTTGPGNMALGASPVANTQEMYSIFSQELAAIGVFCNLSPAADVNSNPLNPIIGTRSFGEDPGEVADRVKAAVKGLHKHRVIATAKHFPGHGNTSSDSHSGIPRVTSSLQEIEAIDLHPFKASVKAGVDIMMTSHIIYDALDSIHPATLSPTILNDYLRKKLGFKGLIISDSFNMGAIQKNYNPSEAAITAINAGVDMIMLAEERYGEDVGDYVQSQMKMIDDVVQAVLSGEIPMDRIDDAYNRIIQLKQKYDLANRISTDVELASTIVGNETNKAAAVRIAEAALYVVDSTKSLLPLKEGSAVSVVKLAKENVEEIIKIAAGIGPNYYNAYADFVVEMKAAGFDVTEYSHDDEIPEDQIIIGVSENYPLPGVALDKKEQRRRLKFVREKYPNAAIVNVALKDPYDAKMMLSDAYVTPIGSNISNIKAVVNLLKGQVEANGKLPVSPLEITKL